MEYRYFGLKIIVRIIILFFSLLILVLAITGTQNYVTSTVFLVLVVIESLELTWFVNRINREIGHFIESIRLKDYTLNFHPERSGRTFRSLRKAFGQVLNDLQEAREKQESQYLQLQIILDHMQVAILLFDSTYELNIFNRAAENIFSRVPGMNYLQKEHKHLYEFIKKAQPGQKDLYELNCNGQHMTMSVRKSIFIDKTEQFTIISLQDIHFELDAREVDAWHKLIRVLTHEIMNSVTPLNSLSQALKDELKEARPDNISSLMPDLLLSVETINSRSKDLMRFISDYKKLTRSEKPVFEHVDLAELLSQLEKLYATELKKSGIAFRIDKGENHAKVKADHDMIMRVLINLVQNAIDALQEVEKPELTIELRNNPNGFIVNVKDNGKGIPSDVLPEIFIPFFTTRKKGSGVGLSLSRRIMQLHDGTITVDTQIGEGTRFTLYFKKS